MIKQGINPVKIATESFRAINARIMYAINPIPNFSIRSMSPIFGVLYTMKKGIKKLRR